MNINVLQPTPSPTSRALPANLKTALKALGLCAALATVQSVDASSAQAQECSDEARSVGTVSAAMVGLPLATIATFLAPALASVGDDSLSYGEGLGWSFLGAFGAGGTSLGVVAATCPGFGGIPIPGLTSVAGAALSTTIWAVAATEDQPELPVAVGFEPQPDGVVMTIGGRF